MNDLNRPDLEGRLRDHYETMPIGSSRELVSRVTEAMDPAPRRRWPVVRLSARMAAVGALGLAALALAAVVASPLWFGQTAPAGPAATRATATATATASGGPQASITPGFLEPDPSAILANARVSALGRMELGGVWAVQGSSFCQMPDASNESCYSPWPGSDTEPPAIFVLDETHAWTITLTAGSVLHGQGPPFDHLNVIVNRIINISGRTWQQVPVPGDYTDSQLAIAFSDPPVGYIVASPHDSGPSTVLATEDGGASWNVAATVQLPHGSLGAELTASDDSTLWAGGQSEAKSSHPLLAVSRDGGKTWSEVTLPGLEGVWAGDGTWWMTEPPTFLDPSTGFVTVTSGDSAAASGTEVFGTTDGGRTWTRENMPVGFYTADFIDASRWVAASGTTLTFTSDGGRTWQAVWPNGMPASAGLPAGTFVGLVFLDPNDGFATYRPDGAADNYLYRTSNGGISWELASTGQG
jgi:photosystem II stability/assembly factor-like uncharacterized protein